MSSPVAQALAKVKAHGLKYSAVSVINVIVGQSLIVLFHNVLDVDATKSNVLAVCISAIPAYYLSRAWVWGKRGKSHLTKEILPFWGFALAGLLLSTLAVDWAAGISDNKWIPNIANLSAFGVLWVVKFFMLDTLIFGKHQHHPVPDAEVEVHVDPLTPQPQPEPDVPHA